MRNLGTKENRLHDLKCQFEYLTKGGYTQEAYKDLNIFTLNKDGMLILKVFRGTSTNPIHYIRYRTPESLEKVVGQYKASADRREKEKEDNKGKRTLTGAALCALAIREELKKQFPSYKFSVTSDNFAGGNSVHISWTDGPTEEQVTKFTNKYQYGHFNGMEDIYEYSNNIEGLPQTKYVSTSREINPELKNRLLPEFEKLYKSDEPEYSRNSTVNTLHRILSNTEIKNADNVKGIKEIQQNGSFEDCFKLTYHKNEKETVQADTNPNIKPIESAEGEVNVIEYSDKAIAVIGDTKPIKELLKSLGGSFNPRLSCGAGWIFSKKKLEEVQTALINHAKTSTEEPQPENINLPVLYTSTPSNVQNIEEAEIIEETPTGKALSLEYFKILWHEGKQNPYFTGAIFTDWQEVQKVFYKLWEVNEKGQNGGYTKVKCEIKFKGVEAVTDRIDITNRVNNGDFNPSQMHVLEYLRQTILEEGEEIEEPAKDWRKHPELEHRHPLNICDPESNQYKEALKEYEAEHPKKYKNIIDITAAAKSGKPISIYNLFDIVNTQTVNA